MILENYTIVRLENTKTRNHIREKRADRSIILEKGLKNTKFRMNSVGTWLLPMVGSCERGNIFLCSIIIDGGFLNELSNCQFPTLLQEVR
jgi:hypothetical protein